MDSWLNYLHEHAGSAHWFIFTGALLAGLNIPISIDLLMIISASIAAAILPENTIHLFLAIFLGCGLSAWISYWLGRVLGKKLCKLPPFSRIFNPDRMNKIGAFYKRRKASAFLIGRFIPFGIRNCLFMSSGMSKIPFAKFALWDGCACALWSLVTFSLYYSLGKNIHFLYTHMKIVNLIIFLGFSVTVIGIIWYKKRKSKTEGNV